MFGRASLLKRKTKTHLSFPKLVHTRNLSAAKLRYKWLFYTMLNCELLGCACGHARGHVLYVYGGKCISSSHDRPHSPKQLTLINLITRRNRNGRSDALFAGQNRKLVSMLQFPRELFGMVYWRILRTINYQRDVIGHYIVYLDKALSMPYGSINIRANDFIVIHLFLSFVLRYFPRENKNYTSILLFVRLD